MAGENKASNTKSGLSYINTAGEANATNDITKINDNNVAFSATNFISSSTDIGVSVGINFNSYFSKYDIEAIVYYNFEHVIEQINSDGLRFELLNVNDNIRFSSTSLTGIKFALYSGPRIGDATTTTERSSTQIIDKGDSQMEYPTEVTDLDTLNYLFSKVRVIRTSNPSYLQGQELQMFIAGDNKLFNANYDAFTTATTHSASGGVSMINNNNFSNSTVNTFLSTSTSTIGDNFGIDLNNSYFSKYDIESIVFYSRITTGFNREQGLRIELLNTHENVRVSSSEISLDFSFFFAP